MRTLLVWVFASLLGVVPLAAQDIGRFIEVIVTPTTASASGSTTLSVAETSHIRVTCSAGGGCAATLSETGTQDGQDLAVCNASGSAGSVTFADSSGVQETVGGTTVTLAANECVLWKYSSDRWTQVGGSGGGSSASSSASYVTKVAEAGLSNEFALGSLATGLLKNTTTTGVPTIATAGTDYFGPGANAVPTTTGTINLGSSTILWNDAYFTRVWVGNDSPSFTGPTRAHSVNQTYTGTLGSTSYTADYSQLTITPTGSAYSGTARASERYVFSTGSQNITGETDGATFAVGNATTGTVSQEVGFIAAISRNGGPSTSSAGIRVDRTYTGAGAVVSQGYGIQIGQATLASGATFSGGNRGLAIADQTVGSATAFQIQSDGANGSTWYLYSNGHKDYTTAWTSATPWDAHGSWYYDSLTYTGGDLSGNRDVATHRVEINPSANLTRGIFGKSYNFYFKGTHSTSRSLVALTGYLEFDDTVTTTGPGGYYASALDGEFGNYTTSGTVPQMNAASCSWGTGTGSTTTLATCLLVDTPWETSGTVTNAVGIEINDQTYSGTSAANNWAIKYNAPSSKTFGVRANGNMVLGGVLYTFPASDATGCLQSNGSGTLSWASCSGSSGYTTVADEGSSLTARATLNFTGAGVSCVDNAGSTRTDCTISGGGGGVAGPGSSTDNAVARFDGTGGATIQNSAVSISDSGVVSGVAAPSATTDAANKTYVDTQIAAAIPASTAQQNSFLVTGGQVVWETGFQFRVSAATYYIAGTQYTSAEQTVTLTAADGSNDRIDVIVLDTSGTADKVTGMAAAAPSEPSIDVSTQLKLVLVSVPAASTAPPGVSNTLLYAENTGGPGEWNWTTSGSGFNVNSTTNPKTGTKDIEGTTVANGAYAQAAIPSGTLDLTTITQLTLFIRSKATWNSGRALTIGWYSSGVLRGNLVTLGNGSYGFSSSNTSSYQQIAIPVSHFAVPTGFSVNQLRIIDSGGSIGFYIDDINVQLGTSSGSSSGMTQAQADARYLKQTSNLSDLATVATARTNLGAAASGAVTASGLTMATARLLGRTTASTGAIEEITVGSGLSLSAGSLTATGGAAGQTTGITVDGAGSVITTGVKGFNVVPQGGTITSVTLLSTDASATACSVVFDIWKDTYANYPPVVGDSITASAKPTLSSANKSRDTTLTGWTTSVTAGDILGYSVDSVTGCTRVTLVLVIQ